MQKSCIICQEVTKQEFTALACAHTFHSTCIEQWIQVKPNCPLCRMPTNGKIPDSDDDNDHEFSPPTDYQLHLLFREHGGYLWVSEYRLLKMQLNDIIGTKPISVDTIKKDMTIQNEWSLIKLLVECAKLQFEIPNELPADEQFLIPARDRIKAGIQKLIADLIEWITDNIYYNFDLWLEDYLNSVL